jgi:hypothetical protein
MLLRLSVCLAALIAAKPLAPNQNPELTAWEDELIKARVDVPEDPASNTTYNRAKHPDERHSGCSRARAEGAPIVGYYSLSWTEGDAAPVKPDIGIAFSGWAEVYQALSSGPMAESLHGRKYLSVGGANVNGHMTAETLKGIEANLDYVKDAGFVGLCFDIESTQDENHYIPAMEAAFAAVKAKGLKVLVTTSHSAPIKSRAAGKIVDSWVHSDNIDYLSPQLYSSGKEKAPQTVPSNGVGWDHWKNAKATIIPSIVDGSHWKQTQQFFQNQGIPLGGYLQWAEC